MISTSVTFKFFVTDFRLFVMFYEGDGTTCCCILPKKKPSVCV